ncbi:MAG: radical SAM protein, partial [Terriglobales bacterium]
MRAVLISTYDMGRQPLGLALPAAWLRRAGVEVICADVSREPLRGETLMGADAVGLFLPMHTATRLALDLLPRLRAVAPRARFFGYGIYAELYRAQLLRPDRLDAVFGAEYEAALTEYVLRNRMEQAGDLPRLPAVVPDRGGLPPLARYARLQLGDGRSRLAGYAEASRGCKHQCRHCPIVPVYEGRFRVTAVEAVLADIRQQVAAGAEHITFGDPDFFNGPTHALRVAEALHREFPALSYDVTIKVEHLRRHAELLPELQRTGCVLITTAAESFDNEVLRHLDKGHTRSDFEAALEEARGLGLALNPTFVSFTPWTTANSFAAMLGALAA